MGFYTSVIRNPETQTDNCIVVTKGKGFGGVVEDKGDQIHGDGDGLTLGAGLTMQHSDHVS